MAGLRERASAAVLAITLASLPALFGCGGNESPSSPEPALGEEVDLSLFAPATYEGYHATYSITRGKDRIEASTWYCGVETVYDVDPVSGEPCPVACTVIEQEGEWGNEPDVRLYTAERFLYGIKTYSQGRWGLLQCFDPKLPVAPEENPRTGSTFDSGTSNLYSRFIMYDIEYREVETVQTWRTYEALEDSVTVPAGTFYNVLRTKVRERVRTKGTTAADTTTVLWNDTTESVSLVWEAEGIGVIRAQGTVGFQDYEKVLESAEIDGITYPRK
jgi:hypothetical protein